MKNKGEISSAAMAVVMLVIGPIMWFTAWTEIHDNTGYAWEKPYTDFEAIVIGMKWIGIVLFVYALIGIGLTAFKIWGTNSRIQDDSASTKQNEAAKPKVRTTVKIPMQTDRVQTVQQVVKRVLEPEGYEQQTIGGETIWVKGNGTDLVSQRFKIFFAEKLFVIQGWTEDAFLGEMNLSGASEGKEPEKGMYLLMKKIYVVIKKGNL